MAEILVRASAAGEGGPPNEWDSQSPPPESAELLLLQSLDIDKAGRVCVPKRLLAGSVGLAETSPGQPFEMAHPSFGQYVSLKDDYDNYYIVPRKGWARQPALYFYFEVTQGGVSRAAAGMLRVEQVRGPLPKGVANR